MLFLGKLLASDSISLLVIRAHKTVTLTLWDAPPMALKKPVAMVESALWKGPHDGSWKWPLADSQQEAEAHSPTTTGTGSCQPARQFGRRALKAESLMGLQPSGHLDCSWWDVLLILYILKIFLHPFLVRCYWLKGLEHPGMALTLT